MSQHEVVELHPAQSPRGITLGEEFVLALFRVSRGRGLTGAYERIHQVFGTLHGTRNTFAKLQYAESLDVLNAKDQWRAWILMAVLGMNPGDFGGSDAIAPPATDVVGLRAALLLPEMDSNHQPAG